MKTLALVVVALVVANTVAFASVTRRPDMVLMSVSAPPGQVAPGSTFTERFSERNRGRGRARRSATAFYLSPTRRLGAGATHLGGRARVKPLNARKRTHGRARLVVPSGTTAGTYFLIGCADDARKVSEQRERNNCRAARSRIVVTGGAGSGNTPAGCVAIADKPDLAFADTNCDGIDGDASHAIFVSPSGDDANPGSRAAPKRTLADAIANAAGGRDVYAAAGTYAEELHVADGVGVFGGYDEVWKRSFSNETRITGAFLSEGSSEGAAAVDVTSSTSLQLLTLLPSAPSVPGASSYGLRGIDSPGLVLERVTAVAAPGAAGLGGGDGTKGDKGGKGLDGDHFGIGGASPVDHPGGDGGWGNFSSGEAPGHPGVAGRTWGPDAYGKHGGAGGDGGAFADPGGDGEPGEAGDDGVAGTNGHGGDAANIGNAAWTSAPGHDGTRGSGGHGGGGGGGGGTEDCTCITGDVGGDGGGGGGGGEGGGPGEGGQGGGGSFGIFLIDSLGATVRNSTVTAANGGAGGNGGDGADGGLGGPYGVGAKYEEHGGWGAHGGKGGSGGPGGHGGGGAGGPSVAIFGLPQSATPGTSVSHGNGGLGGVPGGPAKGHLISEFGAFGVAADYYGFVGA